MTNSHTSRIDHDIFNMLPRDTIARDASNMLDPLKNHKGERMVAATAVLFALMAERYRGSPEALFEYGKRLLRQPEDFHKKANDEMEALRDFALLRISETPSI